MWYLLIIAVCVGIVAAFACAYLILFMFVTRHMDDDEMERYIKELVMNFPKDHML